MSFALSSVRATSTVSVSTSAASRAATGALMKCEVGTGTLPPVPAFLLGRRLVLEVNCSAGLDHAFISSNALGGRRSRPRRPR
jgi:hypothetical protein